MWRQFIRAWVTTGLIACLFACGQAPVKQGPSSSDAATRGPAVPGDVSNQYQRALDLMRNKNLILAEQELRSLSQNHPDFAGPHLNLGIIYARQGFVEKAENAFKKALNKNPKQPIGFNQLGLLYRDAGRFSDAERAYKQAIASAPDYQPAYLNLAILYDIYLQQPEQALDYYQRYQVKNPANNPSLAMWIKDLKMRSNKKP